MPDKAVMWPISTLNPDEAARFWQQKKADEDNSAREAAEEAEQRRAQAKVVRPGNRKGPRTSVDGVATK